MKIKLVKALGIILTAGMLVGNAGSVAAEAGSVKEGDVVSAAPVPEEVSPENTAAPEESTPASGAGGTEDAAVSGTEGQGNIEAPEAPEKEKPEGARPEGAPDTPESTVPEGVGSAGSSDAAGTGGPEGVLPDAVGTVGTDRPETGTFNDVPVVPEGDEAGATIQGSNAAEAVIGVVNGWGVEAGRHYWYQDGVKQSAEGPREVYDPETEAWYGVDNEGAMIINQDVYLEAEEKWVRFGEDGRRVSGEDQRDGICYYFEPVTGAMVKGPWTLPDGRKVLYDLETGQMVKGDYVINGETYHFDETDGHMTEGADDTCFWLVIEGDSYRYSEWVRQGWKPEESDYIGEELYDSEIDAWYWLDGRKQGRMAVDMDVYHETQADDAGTIGKWVHYGEDGRMVRGWSRDRMYYYDPVYGTRAHGIVVIDGVEYEFDSETGRKISGEGFEAYGIQCNVEAGTRYQYKTATYMDSEMFTVGDAVFDYTTFESDETHPAKEGYTWKKVVISMSFGDMNAQVAGCRTSLLFNLDYHTFKNSAIGGIVMDDVIEGERTVFFNGEECPIQTRYELLGGEWGEDGVLTTAVSFECHVPTGYDGMVVALWNVGNEEKGDHALDWLDEDSLIFRMK